jgi:hypothetical protein
MGWRVLAVVAGGVLVVAGIVWTLQGVGDIGGSFMTGSTTWAIIGPVTVIAGLALGAGGVLRRRPPGAGGVR